MAYAREGEDDSDVYVYRGGALCCEGGFHRLILWETTCEADMIEHLHRHMDAGDVVPESALKRLEAERDSRPHMTDVEAALRLARGLQQP